MNDPERASAKPIRWAKPIALSSWIGFRQGRVVDRSGRPLVSQQPPNEFRTYLFSYWHEGASWVAEIKARDASDAVARIKKLPFAKLDGELMMRIPVAAGLLAKIVVPLRNWLVQIVRAAKLSAPVRKH